MKPEVSVIIRVRNEEKWLRRCLNGVFGQEGVTFEVIVVDNMSSDKSIEIAKRFPVAQIIRIEEYSPGLALNSAAEVSRGDYLAILSAHCVPTGPRWLYALKTAIELNKSEGCYGRQVPTAASHDFDKRDLLIAFGVESRVQRKDPFFHNANSMVAKRAWSETRFRQDLDSLEDRAWAEDVIAKGGTIAYEPSAAVFHEDGLHRTSDPSRIWRHMEILGESKEALNVQGPDYVVEGEPKVVALVPAKSHSHDTPEFVPAFQTLIRDLLAAVSVSEVLTVAPPWPGWDAASSAFVSRNEIGVTDDQSLDEVLRRAVLYYESANETPDFYIYANWEYVARPREFFDSLVREAQQGSFDTVFAGEMLFSQLWYEPLGGGQLVRLDDSFLPREKKTPVIRAHYGLGCLMSPWFVRSGALVAGKIGVLPIPESQYNSRWSELAIPNREKASSE